MDGEGEFPDHAVCYDPSGGKFVRKVSIESLERGGGSLDPGVTIV